MNKELFVMDETCKYNGDGHCRTHASTIAILTEIDKKLEVVSTEIKWHNGIGKKFFIAGIALLGVGLTSLVYFGKLDQRVSTLESQMSYTLDHIQDEASFRKMDESYHIDDHKRKGL